MKNKYITIPRKGSPSCALNYSEIKAMWPLLTRGLQVCESCVRPQQVRHEEAREGRSPRWTHARPHPVEQVVGVQQEWHNCFGPLRVRHFRSFSEILT